MLPGTKNNCLKFLLVGFIFYCTNLNAQQAGVLFVKDAKAENRQTLYKNLVNNAINKNLSFPLTDSTEENWMDAFSAIEIIRYQSPWVLNRIHAAFDGIEKRSAPFQRALMELAYANYPNDFSNETTQLLDHAGSDKVFAMCAEYLMVTKPGFKNELIKKTLKRLELDNASVVLNQLNVRLNEISTKKVLPDLSSILYHSFFKKAKVVFSFQRKNRNFPGLVIVRDSVEEFVKDPYGNIFSVPQLARSITNLPGYLSFGNTPQGIFRMDGIAISKSNFIGPTPNIQLTMPFETSLQHFMNNSSITDSVWTVDWYKKLLPVNWRNYFPAFESFYAGKAGRTEIIAHGTTINPEYYKGQSYYPLTPSLGCLCTKEIWSEEDGRRTQSDQQLLTLALKRAGGADGYLIVIELNDDQKQVEISEILPFLQKH